MALVAFGINHKTAPLVLRERLAFQSSRLPGALSALCSQTPANEALLLSTCNRTELYADSGSAQQLGQWLSAQSGVALAELQNNGYFFHDEGALRHVLRVASGLDSMVLGEPQILGQLKKAYWEADQAGVISKSFRSLFSQIFGMTKRVRQESDIGRNPITLGYSVLQLVKQYYPNLSDTRVLLVGTGEMTQLMLSYFKQCQLGRLYVASRHLDKAGALLKQVEGYAIRMRDIPDYLNNVDVVISATSSQLPIIGKGMVERMATSKAKPTKLFVDLAMPRDIEPEVGDVKSVKLYNLDDLQGIIQDNMRSRSVAAQLAESLIEDLAKQYFMDQQVNKMSHAIAQFRQDAQALRDHELQRALAQLDQGKDPTLVLTSLARTLTNKMLHRPTVMLRQAAYDGKMDLLSSVKELFEIQ